MDRARGASRRWSAANREKKARAQRNSSGRRLARRRFLISIMGPECADCASTFPDYVMDFHHLRDKEYQIVNANCHRHVQLLVNEASKCVLLCSNCHRIRHYG